MSKENKVLNDQQQNKNLANFKQSVSVEIERRDIATIEVLHDLLYDAHGYSLDHFALKRSRELTEKMYQAFKLHKKKIS